jgi:hypothetical protein
MRLFAGRGEACLAPTDIWLYNEIAFSGNKYRFKLKTVLISVYP